MWSACSSSVFRLPCSLSVYCLLSSVFFFNNTATTEIYTLSLHDALPIWRGASTRRWPGWPRTWAWRSARSEEHTSELQSRVDLVCRLLLEKKKKTRESGGCSGKRGHRVLTDKASQMKPDNSAELVDGARE